MIRAFPKNLKRFKIFEKSRKILDFIQYSDGKNDLFDISRILKINYKEVKKIYKILINKGLIVRL